jgi:hypothetical protein
MEFLTSFRWYCENGSIYIMLLGTKNNHPMKSQRPSSSGTSHPHFICGYSLSVVLFFTFLIIRFMATYANLMLWCIFGSCSNWPNVRLMILYLFSDSVICYPKWPEISQTRISLLLSWQQVCLKVAVHLPCNSTNVLQVVGPEDRPLQRWVGSNLLQGKQSRYATYYSPL